MNGLVITQVCFGIVLVGFIFYSIGKHLYYRGRLDELRSTLRVLEKINSKIKR